jgi:hypothetical protein
MANAKTYKAGTYYFGEDGKLIGREMSNREIKSLSHDQLLEAANGDWQSNSWFCALLLLESPDGKIITYVAVDIENDGGLSGEARCVEVKKGEDPIAAFEKMYKD